MLLPTGTPLYQRLDTAFTNVRELLRALKESKFYGYVEVQCPGYRGVLLCDAGDVVSASEEGEGQRRTGEQAIAGVLARAGNRGGEINVIQLSADLVYHWAALGNSLAVHKDLSTDFTRLDKLLADLARRRHTGHVEVAFGNGSMGLIVLDEGEPVQSLCGGADEGALTDKAAIRSILERAQQAGATINVFQSTGAAIPRTDPQGLAAPPSAERAEPYGVLQGILAQVEAAVDGLARPGTFGTAFRRALAERSEKYPFLDPFEGLFEFGNGRLAFRGEEGPEVVIPAVRDCLVQVVKTLAKDPGLAGKGLGSRLQAIASARGGDLPAEFRAWGFDQALLHPGE